MHEPVSFWWENVVAIDHSSTSFSGNVKVAETGYEMLEFLSFCNQERM